MNTRLVKLSILPHKLPEFLDNFNLVKSKIKNFKGCASLKLLAENNQSGVVFTYSEWETAGDLQSYLDSPLFLDTWRKVKPMFSAKAEAWTVSELLNVTA